MITKEDIETIATLARLELTGGEKREFTKTLNEFLNYAKILDAMDGDNIQPTVHVLPLKNVFRNDTVEPSLDREKVLKNAPDSSEGCFRVPRVI